MEMEHCMSGDGEEIRNFLHRIKRTVDKGWPDDLNVIDITVSWPLNITHNEKLKDNKEDRDILTTH